MRLLKKISRNIVRKKIKKNSLKNSNRQFLNYTEIKTCLLVGSINRDEEFGEFIELEKLLKADHKSVFSCCYVNSKETALISDNNRFFITKKDLSFIGKPSNTIINEVKNRKFDVVFDVNQKSFVPLLYILLNVDATLFCGTDKNSDFNFNFLIDTTNHQYISRRFILEQFLFYLKKINS